MESKSKKIGNYDIVMSNGLSCSSVELFLNGVKVYDNKVDYYVEFDILEMTAVDEMYKLEEKNKTIDDWLSVFSV